MIVRIAVSAEYHMEVNDKFSTLVDDYDSELSKELEKLITTTPIRTLALTKADVEGVYDADDNPMIEY